MPLDPRLQPLVSAASSAPPPREGLSVGELRAIAHAGMEQGFLAFGDDGPEVAGVADHLVPVDGGAITVRVYTPHGKAPFPGHLNIHGGGFWLGTLDHFDDACRTLAEGAGCVVASVDYRMAPEHKFPTAPEDCYTALRWVVENAGKLGIDATRVSVGGGSAGGNLSAVVALMARDRGGPGLVFQLLEIPVTDLTMSYPSVRENGEGYLLTRGSMNQYVGYYLADPAEATDPYASPIFAADLSGLPPALVMTAECDPLRDEGEAYGQRLRDAGVPATVTRWDGQIHGSQRMSKLLPAEAKEYQDMVVAALQAAYGQP
jgi:acetyl esterase